MKNFILLLIVGTFSVTGAAFATVGGPTYISQIAYKAADNSVYYLVHDSGGRACPPIIHKLNVLSDADTEVKSCTQLESENIYASEASLAKYNQFISTTLSSLPYLSSVSLAKNNIDVKVKFLSYYKDEAGEIGWTEFSATVMQNGSELGKINFRGCSKDQPHVFEGYMVPSTTAMALLVSNKGDCYEWGYVKETLHLIKGVQYVNVDPVRSYKTESATELNTGNMVVYATEDKSPETPVEPSAQENSPERYKNAYIIGGAIMLFIAAYYLGKRARK